MLNQEQQNWLLRLSDTDSVRIIPFDSGCLKIFEKIKEKIQSRLGKNCKVEHHGASSLGISGQDEIDVYVPVKATEFKLSVLSFENIFGKAKALGHLKRARFETEEQGKRIEIFVVNQEHEEWKKHMKFKKYLLEHPEALDEYQKLKERGSGKSTREYYRMKLEFINEILRRS